MQSDFLSGFFGDFSDKSNLTPSEALLKAVEEYSPLELNCFSKATLEELIRIAQGNNDHLICRQLEKVINSMPTPTKRSKPEDVAKPAAAKRSKPEDAERLTSKERSEHSLDVLATEIDRAAEIAEKKKTNIAVSKNLNSRISSFLQQIDNGEPRNYLIPCPNWITRHYQQVEKWSTNSTLDEDLKSNLKTRLLIKRGAP